MKNCPQCRHEIHLQQPPARFCPQCGQTLATADTHDEASWKSIARLNNLAETGYFADMLEANEISTNVVQRNDYSALDGSWETVFVLQVRADRADEAAETLKREIDEGQHDDAYWDATSHGDARRPYSPAAMWKPVALVLVAGGLAYCAGRSGFDRRPATVPRDDELWEALSESPAPLVAESRNGIGNRRVTIDSNARLISVDDDLDGDRKWDHVRLFKDGRLVEEALR